MVRACAHWSFRRAIIETFHTHSDENGLIVKGYHPTETALLSFGFWLSLTLGFPVEHFLWEKVWPFKLLTRSRGL